MGLYTHRIHPYRNAILLSYSLLLFPTHRARIRTHSLYFIHQQLCREHVSDHDNLPGSMQKHKEELSEVKVMMNKR